MAPGRRLQAHLGVFPQRPSAWRGGRDGGRHGGGHWACDAQFGGRGRGSRGWPGLLAKMVGEMDGEMVVLANKNWWFEGGLKVFKQQKHMVMLMEDIELDYAN